ncbi:hypothetical protein niasHS_000716 [Heterodera schachtii]|uniref:Large ribosomal subunit protein uL24m n=1 Tax=Heterodera schachtii TaxID=97005 RepID=A0ABD2KBS1_HETSC
MRLTCQAMVRKLHAELDYARHFPKAYLDKAQRHVPMKVYDNRFGAPPVIRWAIRPDDWAMRTKRPWEYGETTVFHEILPKKWNKLPTIPAQNWTIFPGDTVQVMVGKHKGRKSNVSHVIKESNAVFVEGLHTKLVDKFNKGRMKEMGIGDVFFDQWEEQPLFLHKGEVELVDPSDGEPCTAKWVLNDSKTEYQRISSRTGFLIPLPSRAFTTYDYVAPETYLEVPGKDTPAEAVLKRTYMPKLSTFEQEIEEQMKLEKRPEGETMPTYCPNEFYVLADSAGGSPGECLDKLARELGLAPYKGSFAAQMEQMAKKCPPDEVGRFALPSWSFGDQMDFNEVKGRYLSLLHRRKEWRNGGTELAVWCAGIQHTVTELICHLLAPTLAFFCRNEFTKPMLFGGRRRRCRQRTLSDARQRNRCPTKLCPSDCVAAGIVHGQRSDGGMDRRRNIGTPKGKGRSGRE